MLKLSAKLIRDARAGDPTKIRELASAIESSSYNEAALDACLAHLREQLLDKPRCGIQDPGIFDLRWASITCLHRIMRACATKRKVNSALKTATVERLVDAFEGVTAWMDLVLSESLKDKTITPKMISDMAEVLHVMMTIDDRLQSLITDSLKSVNLCLKLWCSILRSETEWYPDISEEDGAPAVSLMSSLLENAPEAVYDCILSSSRLVRRNFSIALTARFKRVNLWGDPSLQYSEYLIIEYAVALKDITLWLAANPGVETDLRKERYLFHWARAIENLHKRLKGRLRHVIINQAKALLDAIRGSNRNPVKGIFDAFECSIFTVIFDLFRTESPPNVEGKREGGVLLWNDYLSYAYYPRSHHVLREAIITFPQSQIDRILTKDHLNPDWCRWMAVVNQGWRIQEVVDCTPPPHDRQCDNLHHQPWPAKDLTKFDETEKYPVKACTGCRTVLYCSPRCQKEDWEARHHGECSIMRYSRLKLQEQGVHYTTGMRVFHAAMITENLNKTPPERLFSAARQRWSDKAPKDLISVTNYCGGSAGPGTGVVIPLDMYLSGVGDSPGDCPALNDRGMGMKIAFQSRPASDVVSLTEATFSWTIDNTIFMTAEHHWNENVKKWELERCIYKIGSGKASSRS